MKRLLEPVSSSKTLEGETAGQLRKFNLKISLWACVEEIRDSKVFHFQKWKSSSLDVLFYTEDSGGSPAMSFTILILLSPLILPNSNSKCLPSYWEEEKMPTEKTNKVPEPHELSSGSFSLAFECRSPRKWWIEAGFTQPDI